MEREREEGKVNYYESSSFLAGSFLIWNLIEMCLSWSESSSSHSPHLCLLPRAVTSTTLPLSCCHIKKKDSSVKWSVLWILPNSFCLDFITFFWLLCCRRRYCCCCCYVLLRAYAVRCCHDYFPIRCIFLEGLLMTSFHGSRSNVCGDLQFFGSSKRCFNLGNSNAQHTTTVIE